MGRHHRPEPTRGRALAALTLGVAALSATPLATTASAAPAATPAAGSLPCTATAKACVDLSTHQAWLTDNGRAVYGPITMNDGAEGMETPTGAFTVQWKDRDHRSSEFNNAPMPYSVFFDGNGRSFHGGDVAKQSAGCIRLPLDAAKRFFETLQPGDEVQIVP